MADGRDPRRDFLLSLFQAGLSAVNGRRRMRKALAGRDDLDGAWIVAVGKAAPAMTLGALDALGSRVERALVVTRQDCIEGGLAADPRVEVRCGGHPVPDAASLEAGEAVLAMAAQVTPGRPVLLLVSGGASSLLEALPSGVTLQDLRHLTEWALASGRDIGQVNALRRRLSRLKDGRLLSAFVPGRLEGYFISDVPGDDPAVVGSGLLAQAPGTGDLPPGLPAWVVSLVQRSPPASGEGMRIPLHCVGCLEDARAAIVAAAGRSLPVSCPPGRIAGDAAETARDLCAAYREHGRGLWVLGGETTVVLPEPAGRGGRNQHLALAAACAIEGRDDLLLLAAGTDGSDGNTADAGALVDGGTVQRGQDAGLDAARCLAHADSGRFLEASGDLVHTGATGTNVGDLVLVLCCEARHSPGPMTSM